MRCPLLVHFPDRKKGVAFYVMLLQRFVYTAVQRSVLEGCVQIATPAGKVALGKAIEDSCDAKSLTL